MSEQAFTWTLVLPAQASSVRQARDFVAGVLDEWGLTRLREEAILLTSEVVTNAVVHARTDLTLSVVRDDERRVLRVCVVDSNPAVPRRRRYSPLATTGRGLAMVDMAAQTFGVEPVPNGKAVWFELSIPPAAPPGST